MKHGVSIELYPMACVALAFALGIVVADAVGDVVPSCVWMCSFAFFVVVQVVCHLRRSNPVFLTIAELVAVMMVGVWRLSICRENLDIGFVDNKETFTAVVVAEPVDVTKPEMRSRRWRCEMIAADGRAAGHRIYVYFTHWEKNNGEAKMPVLKIGDGLRLTSCLRPVVVKHGNRSVGMHGAGHFDYSRWLETHDIVARAFVGDGQWSREVIGLQRLSGIDRVKIRLAVMRSSLLSRLREGGLIGDAYAVVAAMTLGDKSMLGSELRDTYSVSGVSHVLALSGLHIGIIYMLLTLLFVRSIRNDFMYMVVLLGVWGYVAMVGMPPSAVRSAVMCTMFAFTLMLTRRPMSLNTLGLAALLLLAVNPMSLWDVGFQMSFMAVFGILMSGIRLNGLLPMRYLMEHRLLNNAVQMVIVSLAAQLMTAPLVIYYFGSFSCYFLLSNFIAIPLAMAIVYSMAVVIVVIGVSWLGAIAVKVMELEVMVLNESLAWVARLPGASIDNININGWQVMLIYVLIALLYILSFYVEKMYRMVYGYRLNKYVRRDKTCDN